MSIPRMDRGDWEYAIMAVRWELNLTDDEPVPLSALLNYLVADGGGYTESEYREAVKKARESGELDLSGDLADPRVSIPSESTDTDEDGREDAGDEAGTDNTPVTPDDHVDESEPSENEDGGADPRAHLTPSRAEYIKQMFPEVRILLPIDGEYDLDSVLPKDAEYGPRGLPVLKSDGKKPISGLVERDYWVNRPLAPDAPKKQPFTPYKTVYGERGRKSKWNFSGELSEDERPETTYDEAKRWADADELMLHAAEAEPKEPAKFLDGEKIGPAEDLTSEEEACAEWRTVKYSGEYGLGVILPKNVSEGERRVSLIDWDDVRDPETGEVHPFCVYWVYRLGGYAEISQSETGIHQFVYGELPGTYRAYIQKFDIPFLADPEGVDEKDCPAVEIYGGPRFCAVTEDHVAGTRDGLVDGHDAIREIMEETGAFTTLSSDLSPEETVDYDVPSVPYAGDGLDSLDPDLPVIFAAIIDARRRGVAGVENWKLIGYATAHGLAAGLTEDEILDVLPADPRNRKEVQATARKFRAGDFAPPSIATLKRCGVLPDDHPEDDGKRSTNRRS